MSPRPKAGAPAIERVIANSKRITADLMLLRHEIQEATTEARMKLAQDRIYLVMSCAHELCDELGKLWDQAREFRHRGDGVRLSGVLGNGKPMLVAGRD